MGQTRKSSGVGSVILLVGVALGIISVVCAVSSRTVSTMYWLASVAFLVAVGCGIVHRFEPVSPVSLFLAGYVLYYIMPGYAILAGYGGTEGLERLMPTGITLQLSGFGAYLAGYMATPRTIVVRRREARCLDWRLVRRLGWMLVTIGLSGAAWTIVSAGGAAFFFIPVGQRSIGILWTPLIPGSMLLVACALESARLRRAVAIGTAMALFLVNFTIARRYTVAVVVFGLVYYHLRVRPIRWAAVAIVGLMALVLSVFLGVVRSFVHLGGLTAVLANTSLVWRNADLGYVIGRLEPVNYFNFLQLVDVVPRWSPYLLGESYLKLLMAPIPRALMPDKSESVTRLVVQLLAPEKYLSSNLSMGMTAFGEMYWNFGLLGVLMISALWGIGTKLIWNTMVFLHRVGDDVAPLLYSACVFSIMLESFRGGFSNIAVNLMIFYLAPIALCVVIARAWPPVNHHASRGGAA